VNYFLLLLLEGSATMEESKIAEFRE